LIRNRAALGHTAVLSLIAGKKPLPIYQELIYLHREERLSFGNVVTFNLDEYLGLKNDHPAGFRCYIQRNLFDYIDIPPANIDFLSTAVADVRAFAHYANYRRESPAPAASTIRFLAWGASVKSDSSSRGFRSIAAPTGSCSAIGRAIVPRRAGRLAAQAPIKRPAIGKWRAFE
jgi:hypothetical protein